MIVSVHTKDLHLALCFYIRVSVWDYFCCDPVPGRMAASNPVPRCPSDNVIHGARFRLLVFITLQGV